MIRKQASLVFLVTLISVSGGNTVPHWEDLECEVKLNILSIIVLTVVTNTGGSQVPVLGRGHQLGRGAGGVRAVRGLAGQHRRREGAQLSAGVWTLQDRAGGKVVLDWR